MSLVIVSQRDRVVDKRGNYGYPGVRERQTSTDARIDGTRHVVTMVTNESVDENRVTTR